MLISQGLNICNLWSVIYILLLAIRMHNQNIDTTLNVLSASDAGFVGRSAVHLFLSLLFHLDGKLCILYRGWLHISSEVNFAEVTGAFVTSTWVPVPFYLWVPFEACLKDPVPEKATTRSLSSAAQHEHSAPETRHWLAVYWSTLKPRALEEMVILGAPLTLCLLAASLSGGD